MVSQFCKKWTGLLSLTIVLLFFVVFVIFAAYSYDLVQYDFVDSEWNSIYGLTIFLIIIIFVIIVFGYFVFFCDNRLITFIFLILWPCLFALIIAVLILAYVFGSIEYDDTLIGCTDDTHGIGSMFAEIDAVVHEVNNNLCSSECPCAFSNSSAYNDVPNSEEERQFWTNTSGTANNFGECPEATKENLWVDLQKENEYIKDFNHSVFYEFFGVVEEHFTCVGWCKRRYSVETLIGQQDLTTKNRFVIRYLFSKLQTDPIPDNYVSGCMKEVYEYLNPIYMTVGSILALLALTQIIVFIAALLMCCKEKKSD